MKIGLRLVGQRSRPGRHVPWGALLIGLGRWAETVHADPGVYYVARTETTPVLMDFDGEAHDAAPDISADEYVEAPRKLYLPLVVRSSE